MSANKGRGHYGFCRSCNRPLMRTVRFTSGSLHFPDYCARCDSLVKASICKDGTRGYLWAIFEESNSRSVYEGIFYSDLSGSKFLRLQHGWAPSIEAALQAARGRAGGDVAQVDPGIARSIARVYLLERRKERRERGAQRNAHRRGSHTVEYLYDRYTGAKYPISKKTAKRVYFQWTDDSWKDPEERVTSVDRAPLEHGYIPDWLQHEPNPEQYREYGAWSNKAHAKVMTKEHYERHLAQEQERRRRQDEAARKYRHANGVHVETPDPPGQWTAKECRRQMQQHHPDKGGDPEQFMLWRKRYEEARARREVRT